MCAMQLGVAVWLTDLGVGIAELARTVEGAGLESLFLTEHSHVPASRVDLLQGDRPGEDARLLDQFTALGAAAACTSRLRLGTGICILPQHDPIALAKQVATIDHISGGRFLFGVGAGWLVEELRNHAVDPATRWALMEEQLLAMKAIWTADEAEFHGKFLDFDPIWCWPKPIQKPYPPLLVGGDSPRSLRLAALHGDAWAPVVDELGEFDRGLREWRRLRAEAGLEPGDVTVFGFDLDGERLARFAELGVTRIVLQVPVDDADALRRRLDELVALVSG
ncbi:MAG TPA: LLM class F420-dependent oxidoreductase [Gaiellales bacterium]|jgi:probable F420-dependent oxidoreductase|nr:LLM class F420-dependent oxidoreductase [Gaiellales bacterium]